MTWVRTLSGASLVTLCLGATPVRSQNETGCCEATYNYGFSVEPLGHVEPFTGILDAGDRCDAAGWTVRRTGPLRVYVNFSVADPQARVQGAALSIEVTGGIEITGAEWLIDGFGAGGGASVGFWLAEVVEPERNDGRRGLVAAYVEGNYETVVPGTMSVLALDADAVAGGAGVGAFRFTGGLVGGGQPVPNVITDRGSTVTACNAATADLTAVIAPGPFLRGDCNSDLTLDVSDALCSFNWLFLGAETPSCLASSDANSSGRIDIADPVYVLNFLFYGGPPPARPFPECGTGSGVDATLGCLHRSTACAE